MKIVVELNGEIIAREVSPGKRLLDWLREDMGLTGTKEGCGEGECGACTVLLDGQPVVSCLVLMGQVNGREITTIEGIREKEEGKRLINAFVENGAIQCGFCTPGFIMASVPFVRGEKAPTIDEIKNTLAGNLCRCTGYAKIFTAIQQAVKGGK